jgi:hypothetical protein
MVYADLYIAYFVRTCRSSLSCGLAWAFYWSVRANVDTSLPAKGGPASMRLCRTIYGNGSKPARISYISDGVVLPMSVCRFC